MVLRSKADTIGIISSSLCMIHCIATPLLFLAVACTDSCCADAPGWWRAIDYIFLVVSFAAIFYATKHSSKRWVKYALWAAWTLLLISCMSEAFETGWLPEWFIYMPALSIVALHIYNRKYCQCDDDNCLINTCDVNN